MSARHEDRTAAFHMDIVRELVGAGAVAAAEQYIEDLRRRHAVLVTEARAQAGHLRAAERALREAATK